MVAESHFPSEHVRSVTPWYRWFESAKPQNTPTTIPDNNIPLYFKAIYDEVLAHERSILRHQKHGKRDEQWIESTIAKGTFKDKVATITMYVRENPVLSIELLTTLDGLCRDKKRHAAEVLPALIEIFNVTLPINRALTPLERRCQLLRIKPSNNRYILPENKGLISSWYFEDFLLQYLHRFLVWVTDEMGTNPQEWMRQKSIETIFEFLPYPTTTERCINYLLNKMGDPIGKISSLSSSRLRAAIYLLHSHYPWTMSVVEKESDTSRHKFAEYGKENRMKFMMNCITQCISFLSKQNISQKMLKVVVPFIAFSVLPFLQGQTESEVRLISDLSELFFGLLNRQLIEVCKVEVRDATVVSIKNKNKTKSKNKHARIKPTETSQIQEFSVFKYILQGLSISLKYADLKFISSLESHIKTLSAMIRATKYHISMLVATVLLAVAEKARASGQTRLPKELDSQVAQTTVNAYYSLLNRYEAAHVTSSSKTGLLFSGMSRCMQLTTNNIFMSKNIQAAFWKRCLQVGLIADNGSFICGALIALGMTTLKLHTYGISTTGLNAATGSKGSTVLKSMPFSATYLMSSYDRSKKEGSGSQQTISTREDKAADQPKPVMSEASRKPTAHLEILTIATSNNSKGRAASGTRNNAKERQTLQEIEADTNRRYIPEAYNPSTSSAANDEMWELLILQNHYHVGVQKVLNLMITENTFGRYVRSEAADAGKLDTPGEFSSRSMVDFISGRSDYRVSKSRYDTARVYPNVCVNGSMYEIFARLYNLKGKEKRITESGRSNDIKSNTVTPREFLDNYKHKLDIYSDIQKRDIINKMTEEEQEEYLLETMKREGIFDSSGKVVDLEQKHAEETNALYIGQELHNKDEDESSYHLDGDSDSYEFISDVPEDAGESMEEESYSNVDLNDPLLSKRERLMLIKKAAGPRGFVDADLVFGDDSSDLDVGEAVPSPRKGKRRMEERDPTAGMGVRLPMYVPGDKTAIISKNQDSEESDLSRGNQGKELLSDSLLPSDDDDDGNNFQDDVPYVTKAQVRTTPLSGTAPRKNSLQERMQSRARHMKK